MTINVKAVTGRRLLRFESYDDIRRDVLQLMASGPIRSLGNWSVGQNFEHLARSMDVSIDGVDYRLPAWMRLIAKSLKGWFLSRPFKPGFQLPKELENGFGPGAHVSTEDGYRELLASLDRIESTARRAPSPAFGEMPESDWIRLHCRHAELHLSFLTNELGGSEGGG
jgi:Protein of unknown function (DUF1569)